MITLLIVSMAGNVSAQGRGHQKGHERNHAGQHNKGHHNDRDWEHDRKGHHDHDYDRHYDRGYSHHHDRRQVHVVQHHDQYCHQAPVAVRHHHPRPRYIYYRDYDVYYDNHNSVYISYSGRSWTVSASLPVALNRVDVHHAVRMEVDYDHDDFPRYLERSRPAYRRIYTSF
jgi:hypothetical protein